MITKLEYIAFLVDTTAQTEEEATKYFSLYGTKDIQKEAEEFYSPSNA